MRREKKPDTKWRQMLVLAGAAMLLTGCADYFVKMAHFKNNPMDKAIREGDYVAVAKRTRELLLVRFSPGHLVKSVRDYLESVGAKCRYPEKEGGGITCSYTQHSEVVYRTLIGEFPEFRQIFTFRIELQRANSRLRNIRVCNRIAVIWSKGTLSDREKRTEYPMECPEGQNTK